MRLVAALELIFRHVLAMAWNIACATGVPVLEPGTANIIVLLVDLQGHIFEQSLSFVRQLKASRASPNTDKTYWALGVNRKLRYFVVSKILSVPLILM